MQKIKINKNFRSYRRLLSLTQFYMAISVLPACQPAIVNKDISKPATVTPQSQPQNPSLPDNQNNQQTPAGPSDTGGGNGQNGKIYESFIVDPTKLDAYKKIEPVIDRINQAYNSKKDNSSPDDQRNFKKLFKLKTWYIAPLKLKPLDSKVIGLEFAGQTSQQLAVQTNEEIWIDKSFFEKMDFDEQARLILHEYVMNLYLFKFKNFDELCKMSYRFQGNSKCEGLPPYLPPYLKALMKGLNPRPLNENDYPIIRRITDSLFTNVFSMSDDEIENMFLSNDFDYRLFARNNFDNVNQKITFDQLFLILKKSEVNHALRNKCRFLKIREHVACDIQVEKSIGSDNNQESILLKIIDLNSASVLTTYKIFRQSEYMAVSTKSFRSNSYKTEDGYILYVMEALPKDINQQTKLQSLGLYFSKGYFSTGNIGNDLTLDLIHLLPRKYVGSTTEIITKENQNYQCTNYHFVTVVPQDKSEDGISIGKNNSIQSYLSLVSNMTFPMNSCVLVPSKN